MTTAPLFKKKDGAGYIHRTTLEKDGAGQAYAFLSKNMYFVYILESRQSKQIYIGSTNNLERRLLAHNSGEVFSTKSYVPWHVLYYEAYQTEGLAMVREQKLKHHGNAVKEIKKRAGLAPHHFSEKGGAGRAQHHLSFRRSGAGFTLVELIIYLGIFAIIGTLGGQVISAVLKTRTSVSRSNEVQVNTSRVLQQIVDRVHTAVTINGASTTLNLKMTDSSKNPTVIARSATGTVTLQEGSSASVPVTPSTVNVTSLSFTLLTNPDPSTSSVQIAITGAYNNAGVADTNNSYSLRTTALPL